MRDENGENIGRFDDDGVVRDQYGERKAEIRDGVIRDENGERKMEVRDGVVRDADGNRLGEIIDGVVRDENGERLGEAQGLSDEEAAYKFFYK